MRDRLQKITHVFFDVDGTLIDDEASGGSVWERIHALAGIGDETRSKRLALHQGGKLSYAEWISLDIRDWQRAGLTKSQILETMGKVVLHPGALETLVALKSRGYTLGVISSSIDVGILSVVPQNIFDELSINRLFFNEDESIQGWDTSACELFRKGERLLAISKALGVPIEQFAFIGNDFNDREAAEVAGVSFSVHSQSAELDKLVDHAQQGKDLRFLLDFLEKAGNKLPLDTY